MNKTIEMIKNSDIDQFVCELKNSKIDYFSLSIIRKNRVFSVISLKEWRNFYMDRQCFDFDPLAGCAFAAIRTPIDWRSVNITKKKGSFIMKSRMDITGCNEGVSMAQVVGDTHMLFALAAKDSFENILNGYLKYQDKIKSLVHVMQV